MQFELFQSLSRLLKILNQSRLPLMADVANFSGNIEEGRQREVHSQFYQYPTFLTLSQSLRDSRSKAS